MKKIYILPNLVTTANIVCGFLAIVHCFKGEFKMACWFLVIAGICDLLDGRIARLARATSPFGVQYDSLADLTSFGIAPSVLIYSFSAHELTRFGISASAFYVVCVALRLARFNVSAEEKDEAKLKKVRKGYFQGLPSPPSAGIVITTVMMQIEFPFIPEGYLKYYMAVLSVFLALLMVSSIPFPSFKEVNWRAKGKAWILLIPAAIILSVIEAPEITMFSIGYVYLFLGLLWATYLCKIRDRQTEDTLAV